MNSFGEKLRKLRKEKGLTIRKLGELSGVAHSYLSQVETGKRGVPKADTLKKIAAGLNIPLVDLLLLAGYVKKKGYLSQEEYLEDKENEKSLERKKLDDLLDSEDELFFQDRLLTKEEKAKIKNLIDIVLKD